MISDTDHFSNLQPPLAPNNTEVDIYVKYIKGTSLLLGYTSQLISLCTDSMDINPPESGLPSINPLKEELSISRNTIKQDWFTIDKFYNTIIGDGVLNLVGGSLVEYFFTNKLCDTLIIRFFTEKIDGMKYATYFSHNTNFKISPNIVIDTQAKCQILIWHFDKYAIFTSSKEFS